MDPQQLHIRYTIVSFIMYIGHIFVFITVIELNNTLNCTQIQISVRLRRYDDSGKSMKLIHRLLYYV